MSERRKFSRISFSGKCTLTEKSSGKTKTWPSELLDISLNGGLVCRPPSWHTTDNMTLQLSLCLDGSDIVLEIAGKVCYQKDDVLGIKFLTLNLDSISHLKRLIQLNLADEDSMHREISQLINRIE